MPTMLRSLTTSRPYRRFDRVVEAFQAEHNCRSVGAAHQQVRAREAGFLALVGFYGRHGAEARIARLRIRFENAADPVSTPGTDEATLRVLLRDLHPVDQSDDTARIELVDGPITEEEEARMLRACYATNSKLTRVARCLEARKDERR